VVVGLHQTLAPCIYGFAPGVDPHPFGCIPRCLTCKARLFSKLSEGHPLLERDGVLWQITRQSRVHRYRLETLVSDIDGYQAVDTTKSDRHLIPSLSCIPDLGTVAFEWKEDAPM